MKNGIYSVHFRTPIGEGTGVAFLKDGTLEGGDAAVYYRGTYSIDGQKFTARIKTGTHNRAPGGINVMGQDSVTLSLEGTFDSNSNASAQGTAPEAPGVTITVKMARVAD
jgi:hypothetical protein